jgi:hypothetical protein
MTRIEANDIGREATSLKFKVLAIYQIDPNTALGRMDKIDPHANWMIDIMNPNFSHAVERIRTRAEWEETKANIASQHARILEGERVD